MMCTEDKGMVRPMDSVKAPPLGPARAKGEHTITMVALSRILSSVECLFDLHHH